jgi:hypothetical protein
LDNKLNKIKTYVSLISLTVFIVSLTQTALTYNDFDGQKIHSSLSLLFMGGLAILGGGLLEWFIWLANPLYVLALIFFFKSNKTSKVVSITATILALSFTTWKEILAAENGRTATIESLNLGYWLWVLSLTILSIGTIYYFRQLDNNNDDRKNHSI